MKTNKTPQSGLPKPAAGAVALLVATRKGGFILRSDKARRAWRTTGPMFFGHIVHHMVLDARFNAKGVRPFPARRISAGRGRKRRALRRFPRHRRDRRGAPWAIRSG